MTKRQHETLQTMIDGLRRFADTWSANDHDPQKQINALDALRAQMARFDKQVLGQGREIARRSLALKRQAARREAKALRERKTE